MKRNEMSNPYCPAEFRHSEHLEKLACCGLHRKLFLDYFEQYWKPTAMSRNISRFGSL